MACVSRALRTDAVRRNDVIGLRAAAEQRMLLAALNCCLECRYYVNAGNVPKALQWVPSASLIKQAFEGLCDNEFPGLRFDPLSADGSGDIVQGEQVRCLTSVLVLLHVHDFCLPIYWLKYDRRRIALGSIPMNSWYWGVYLPELLQLVSRMLAQTAWQCFLISLISCSR